MNFKDFKFDDYNETENEKEYYFTGSSDIIHKIFPCRNPDAVATELLIRVNTVNHTHVVSISPTKIVDNEACDYDWTDINVCNFLSINKSSEDEIVKEMVNMAEIMMLVNKIKNNNDIGLFGYVISERNKNYTYTGKRLIDLYQNEQVNVNLLEKMLNVLTGYSLKEIVNKMDEDRKYYNSIQ